MFHAPDGPSTPIKDRLKRGLYEDGEWKCNCDPRLPAALQTVRKSNHNHGRRFYTCCTNPPCSFFLWESDALHRQTPSCSPNSTAPLYPQLPTPHISPQKRAASPPSTPSYKTHRTAHAHTSPTKPRPPIITTSNDDDIFTTPARRPGGGGGLFPAQAGAGTDLWTEISRLLTDRQREEGRVEEVVRRHVRIAEGVVRGRRVAREGVMELRKKVGELERGLEEAVGYRDDAEERVQDMELVVEEDRALREAAELERDDAERRRWVAENRTEEVERQRDELEREVRALNGEVEGLRDLTAQMEAARLWSQQTGCSTQGSTLTKSEGTLSTQGSTQ